MGLRQTPQAHAHFALFAWPAARARQLMRVLFKIISGPNQQRKLAGFLPMMATDTIRQHRRVKSDMAHQFGAQRLLPGIRKDIRLAEAFAVGQLIRSYAPKSRGADDFADLAALFANIFFAGALPLRWAETPPPRHRGITTMPHKQVKMFAFATAAGASVRRRNETRPLVSPSVVRPSCQLARRAWHREDDTYHANPLLRLWESGNHTLLSQSFRRVF